MNGMNQMKRELNVDIRIQLEMLRNNFHLLDGHLTEEEENTIIDCLHDGFEQVQESQYLLHRI